MTISGKRQSIAFDSDVLEIIEAHQGRESFNATVNKLIRRAGTIETDQTLLFAIKDLCQRTLAIQNAVYETALTGDVEDARKEYLNVLRNDVP